jgi:hypothetical protein
MTTEKSKDLDYWKSNAEEDYITTPISVLKYITELEQQVNSVDLADVVNCSSCKYQMNGTTEPCRSCILFSNHTPK